MGDDRVKIKLTISLENRVQRSIESSMSFNGDDGLTPVGWPIDLAKFSAKLSVTPVDWLGECRREAQLSRDKTQRFDAFRCTPTPKNLWPDRGYDLGEVISTFDRWFRATTSQPR
ncbi:hypothetical protein [Burkholderia cepacia]|uniref:hypothetical protein n=1 Tax=Burkholderia cepacia TaxID=292 RepID=UPI0012D9E8A6|nr:hypothetical protein [Burkholderia cepacia]